jgi:hypothetical protein
MAAIARRPRRIQPSANALRVSPKGHLVKISRKWHKELSPVREDSRRRTVGLGASAAGDATRTNRVTEAVADARFQRGFWATAKSIRHRHGKV